MSKSFIFILIGIIALIVIIGLVFLFRSSTPKSEKYPLEEGSITPENILKIKGIGFKKEAWAEYKIEGYGIIIEGESRTEKIGKLLVKLISLPIEGKEYIGIELDGKEGSGIEGYSFATLFNPQTNESIYLMKAVRRPTVCLKQLPSTVGGLPYEEFSTKNLENEYTVKTSEWSFIGKENITLESGKKIEVYKFRRETAFEGNKIVNDLWLSGEVPTYLVLNSETIGDKRRVANLTNFGMDGGLPNFNNEDLKACSEGIPEIPGLPKEAVKLYCQTDEDCACGVDKETGKCAVGNKRYIDTSIQCPDFCTGIAGNLRIKCVNNVCMAVPV
ncbi:MAG: hypothetical protein QXR71_04410 [Candidatus Aenigmatarchaeota archaeon]